MAECLFCKIIDGQVPAEKVYEDDKIIAFLDINPVSQGHLLIVPKAHAQCLSQGSLEDALAVMRVIHSIAPKIMQALSATGYNLGMNEGEVAGQVVMHTHVHLMPRYEGQARTFTKMHPTKDMLAATRATLRAAM